MGRFTKISQNAFNELQVEAGVLLKDFDPATPELLDEDIVCATTGGISPSCVATYSDFAEDVDNAPVNMLEFKRITGWECSLGFTALNITAETIQLALGAADVNAETGKVTPRRDLQNADFNDIWWVGDRSDGGFVAIKLLNALSTSGFSLQTTKGGKGQMAVTLTGHVSSDAQDVMPMEFYVIDGTDVPEETESNSTTEEE